jgi:hypothetical protein
MFDVYIFIVDLLIYVLLSQTYILFLFTITTNIPNGGVTVYL